MNTYQFNLVSTEKSELLARMKDKLKIEFVHRRRGMDPHRAVTHIDTGSPKIYHIQDCFFHFSACEYLLFLREEETDTQLLTTEKSEIPKVFSAVL